MLVQPLDLPVKRISLAVGEADEVPDKWWQPENLEGKGDTFKQMVDFKKESK